VRCAGCGSAGSRYHEPDVRITSTWFFTAAFTLVSAAPLSACSPAAGAPSAGTPPVEAAPLPASPEPSTSIRPAASPSSSISALLELAPPPVDDRPRPQRQWDHVVARSGADCREQLAATGAKFTAIPDRLRPDAKGCGIPRGVLLSRGPSGLRYSPPVSLDCSLALALVDVERVLQEEAQLHLGSPLERVGTLGSFACRKPIGRLAKSSEGISEHSFGNAIDMMRFDPVKGAPVSVLRGYEVGVDVPKTPAGRFLRSALRRLWREGGVRVLGPDFDASHRDHFHVDAGLPRWR
jgi:hypothetical protein